MAAMCCAACSYIQIYLSSDRQHLAKLREYADLRTTTQHGKLPAVSDGRPVSDTSPAMS